MFLSQWHGLAAGLLFTTGTAAVAQRGTSSLLTTPRPAPTFGQGGARAGQQSRQAPPSGQTIRCFD